MAESMIVMDERLREEASRAGRAELDDVLQRFTATERDAFWNAIGLYYSTRRHPGANESKPGARTARN